MDLQVVVWLFYCFLLPAALLTGRWCNLCGYTAAACKAATYVATADPPLAVLTLLVTRLLGGNCSRSWRANCKKEEEEEEESTSHLSQSHC